MEVSIKKNLDSSILVKASGKLDIDNSADFGAKVKDAIEDTEKLKELVIDFQDITYIASIGLRILLELYKMINEDSAIRIINAQPQVLDVLKMTGFDKFIKIS